MNSFLRTRFKSINSMTYISDLLIKCLEIENSLFGVAKTMSNFTFNVIPKLFFSHHPKKRCSGFLRRTYEKLEFVTQDFDAALIIFSNREAEISHLIQCIITQTLSPQELVYSTSGKELEGNFDEK